MERELWNIFQIDKLLLKNISSQAQGLTLVIPALWEAEEGRSSEDESSKTSLTNVEKPHLY